jgi:hypothetical protein
VIVDHVIFFDSQFLKAGPHHTDRAKFGNRTICVMKNRGSTCTFRLSGEGALDLLVARRRK